MLGYVNGLVFLVMLDIVLLCLLKNIYVEMWDDLGVVLLNGDLVYWVW